MSIEEEKTLVVAFLGNLWERGRWSHSGFWTCGNVNVLVHDRHHTMEVVIDPRDEDKQGVSAPLGDPGSVELVREAVGRYLK